jgi:hypothetical protein
MAFVEDLAPFFADFPAVDATLDGQALRVIFDREYVQAFDGIGSTGPAATAPSASVGAATTSSMLVVAGNTYRVRSVQPDGTGVSLLLLELQ